VTEIHRAKITANADEMSLASTRERNSFFRPTSPSSLMLWVVLLPLLAGTSATASDETDCRELSEYETGPAPETCTAQLTLGSTEHDIINALRATCDNFPIECHSREYRTYAGTDSAARKIILMGCLHDAIVGATGRTSVYTKQLSARLSVQL